MCFRRSQLDAYVDGQRVAIETKPLEILRALLLRAGNVVSKGELLDAIWPDVTVVEASLPTAVDKLRRALGDDRRDRGMIETAPGIGYRFAVPVEVEERPPHADFSQHADSALGSWPARTLDRSRRKGQNSGTLTAVGAAAIGFT